MPKNVIDSFSGEYDFLSNFYPVEIKFDGIVYPSVEHAYQAMKTLDPFERARIANAATPGKAKRLGSKVVIPYDNWEEMKLNIMYLFVGKKFGNGNPELQKKLVDTGSAILIEGNHWGDTFWGQCKGVGENHLGKILMEIRHCNQFFVVER